MSMEIVRVPDIGSDDAVDVIEIPIKVGDQLVAEDTIVVLESDKATVEVPLPQAGTVKKILVKNGDRVKQGDPLLELEVSAAEEPAEAGSEPEPEQKKEESAASNSKKPSDAQPAEKTKPEQKEAEQSKGEQKVAAKAATKKSDADSAPAATTTNIKETAPSSAVHAGPAVRKLARELGVDLAAVTGTGPRERILRDDVHGWVKGHLGTSSGAKVGAGLPALPEIDFSQFGPVERIELSKLRKLAASNLHRSWLTIPHVTQNDEADITELEAFRKSENIRLQKSNAKLTMLAFLLRASALALEKFPRFNSSLSVDGEVVIEKRYVHIGVAVETENGLLVPVLRDANKKGIVQIAAEVAELAEKARNRKITPADMQGGTFSISSLGGIGGTTFTPIVNWPEVAILGVGRAEIKPHWNGKEFEPRLMLPLSLSYDHRAVDGADAARFITYLNALLTDLRRALL